MDNIIYIAVRKVSKDIKYKLKPVNESKVL